MDLLSRYHLYLYVLGYKVHSINDKQNSIDCYVDAVKTIADWEGLSIEELAKDIKKIFKDYDKGGVKYSRLPTTDDGRTYNGLKHFTEFISLCNKGTV